MSDLEKKISVLGLKAKDKVTGIEGVITSYSFDIHGCMQVVLTPGSESSSDAKWFDVSRLDISEERVIDCPDFGETHSPAGIASCSLSTFARGLFGCTHTPAGIASGHKVAAPMPSFKSWR